MTTHLDDEMMLVPRRMFEAVWSLKGSELRLLFIIGQLTIGVDREWVDLSIRDLADAAGMNKGTVQRGLDVLLAHEPPLIVLEERPVRGGRSARYQLAGMPQRQAPRVSRRLPMPVESLPAAQQSVRINRTLSDESVRKNGTLSDESVRKNRTLSDPQMRQSVRNLRTLSDDASISSFNINTNTSINAADDRSIGDGDDHYVDSSYVNDVEGLPPAPDPVLVDALIDAGFKERQAAQAVARCAKKGRPLSVAAIERWLPFLDHGVPGVNSVIAQMVSRLTIDGSPTPPRHWKLPAAVQPASPPPRTNAEEYEERRRNFTPDPTLKDRVAAVMAIKSYKP